MVISVGTVLGNRHLKAGLNNQDALQIVIRDNYTIGVIADGCSSAINSEVGAKIGTKLISQILDQRIKLLDGDSRLDLQCPRFWDLVKIELLEKLRVSFGCFEDFRQTVLDYLLFTMVGFVIKDEAITFFWIGDGAMQLNQTVVDVPEFANNAPPYLGYLLLRDEIEYYHNLFGQYLDFGINSFELRTGDRFLIASDGIKDLILAKDSNIPGRQRKVGSIDQFWEDPKFLNNSDHLRRFLRSCNRNSAIIENGNLIKEEALLDDDTTIIFGRIDERPIS